MVSELRWSTNVWIAVRKVITATPESRRIAGDVSRPPTLDRKYARNTAPSAPTNAASGTASTGPAFDRRPPMAIVAPRPAPAAAPSRYGSASGLRNTPWYDAPD